MSTFIIGFKNGRVEEVKTNDIIWLTSELNQKGHHYDIAFIINSDDIVLATKYLQTGGRYIES